MTATAIQPTEQTHPAASSGRKRVQGGLLDPKMLWRSTPDALRKLNPRSLCRNPVMFIVEIGAGWSTVLAIAAPSWFAWLSVIWLWLTVLFANLAEAVAEGRGKAQAETLRRAKTHRGPATQGLGTGGRRGRGSCRRSPTATGRRRGGRGGPADPR